MSIESPRSEVQVRNVAVEAEDLQASAQQLFGSLLKAGVSLVLLPVNILPRESRGHFQEAAREITLGVASLTKALGKTLENVGDSADLK